LVPRYPLLNRLVQYDLSKVWEVMNVARVGKLEGPFEDVVFDLEANGILRFEDNKAEPGFKFYFHYKEFEKYMKGLDKLH
jgi:hypothetical protein